MSVARPASRSLVSRLTASGCQICPTPLSRPISRPFHASSQLAARRKPRFKNVRAAELGLVDDDSINNFTEKHFPKYSPIDTELLRNTYTKEQMAALEAGEEAIDARDFTVQGRLRTDSVRPWYLDDYSSVVPVFDHRRPTKPKPDMGARFMSPKQFNQDFADWMDSFVPKDVDLSTLSEDEVKVLAEKTMPKELDMLKYFVDRPTIVTKEGPAQPGDTAMVPELGLVDGVAEDYQANKDDPERGQDEEGIYDELRLRTGMTLKQIKEIEFRTLAHRWISNQTRLGKVQRTSLVVIAGNQNGRLGVGMAKSDEMGIALDQAKAAAILDMQPIRRYENRTIYGNVRAKVSGTVVELYSRPPGFGLRVPQRIYEIARAAGISDLACHITRSRNPMNVVKATVQALLNQPDPEQIAMGRGKKLVDVRKVYYGGAVY